MLRFAITLLVAVVASETAESADRTLTRQGSHHGWRRTTVILPAGLPRAHYNFRTTISYDARHAYRRSGPRLSVYENPALLYAPDYTEVRYIPPRIGVALLPGSSTLPGYYGSTDSYDYQGSYYGGPNVPYWDRLPYACGVYGYC
jgi:hypothetical protein